MQRRSLAHTLQFIRDKGERDDKRFERAQRGWLGRYNVLPISRWPRRWRLRLILWLLPGWWNFFVEQRSFRQKLQGCINASRNLWYADWE